MISDAEHFHLPAGHLYIFYSGLFPTLNQVVCLIFDVELYELFIYFEYESPVDHITCQYFLPFSKLSFHFVNGLLCCAKPFNFN